MVRISPSATAELQRLSSRQCKSSSTLRLSVAKGGCLGHKFVMAFDNDAVDDHPGDSQAVCVVASFSHQFAHGLTIDYSEDLLGGAFRFYHPEVSQFCDCGSSFVTPQGLAVSSDS
jgi:iron-sulfur cluster assembly accessory protein